MRLALLLVAAPAINALAAAPVAEPPSLCEALPSLRESLLKRTAPPGGVRGPGTCRLVGSDNQLLVCALAVEQLSKFSRELNVCVGAEGAMHKFTRGHDENERLDDTVEEWIAGEFVYRLEQVRGDGGTGELTFRLRHDPDVAKPSTRKPGPLAKDRQLPKPGVLPGWCASLTQLLQRPEALPALPVTVSCAYVSADARKPELAAKRDLVECVIARTPAPTEAQAQFRAFELLVTGCLPSAAHHSSELTDKRYDPVMHKLEARWKDKAVDLTLVSLDHDYNVSEAQVKLYAILK